MDVRSRPSSVRTCSATTTATVRVGWSQPSCGSSGESLIQHRPRPVEHHGKRLARLPSKLLIARNCGGEPSRSSASPSRPSRRRRPRGRRRYRRLSDPQRGPNPGGASLRDPQIRGHGHVAPGHADPGRTPRRPRVLTISGQNLPGAPRGCFHRIPFARIPAPWKSRTMPNRAGASRASLDSRPSPLRPRRHSVQVRSPASTRSPR